MRCAGRCIGVRQHAASTSALETGQPNIRMSSLAIYLDAMSSPANAKDTPVAVSHGGDWMVPRESVVQRKRKPLEAYESHAQTRRSRLEYHFRYLTPCAWP
jgi:hypothetical protein